MVHFLSLLAYGKAVTYDHSRLILRATTKSSFRYMAIKKSKNNTLKDL